MFLIICKVYTIFVNTQASHSNESSIVVDFSKLYPVPSTDTSDVKVTQKTSNKYLEKYKSVMTRLGNIHTSLRYDMLFQQEIFQSSYFINMLLSDRNRSSYPTELKNGYYYLPSKKESSASIEKYAVKYSEFEKYVTSQGIDFLYIQPPCKLSKYDNQLDYGLYDYKNSNCDELLEDLRGKGVTCLDLRDEIKNNSIDQYSLFFRTDSHWKSNAGLWAASTISEYCNTTYGLTFNTDSLNANNYETISYSNAMYGSSAYSIPKFLANPEDFEILTPDYETDFTIEIPDKNINATGSFDELFFDHDMLNAFSKKGGDYAYGTVLKGNRPLVRIVNNNNDNGPKVLIIKDSFGNMVSPYLVVACSELNLLDIRKDNGNFNGSVKQFIAETNPDIVIVMLSFPTNESIK